MSQAFQYFGKNVLKTETSSCSICCLRNLHNEVTHQCLDCGDVLCDVCQKGHCASRITHDHRVVPIEDVRSGKFVVAEAQAALPCSNTTHKGATCTYFCQTCGKLMCELCLLFEHKGHEILPLQEAARQCGKQLEEQSVKLETYLTEITSVLEMNSSRRESIIASREDTLKILREKTQAIVGLIHEQEQKAVDKVTRLCESQLLLVSTMNYKLDQITKLCPKVLSLTHSVLEAREDLHLLLLCNDLEKCFKESQQLQDSMLAFENKWKIPRFNVKCDFPNSSVIGIKQSFVSPHLVQEESKERVILSDDANGGQITSAHPGGKQSVKSCNAEDTSTQKQARPTRPQGKVGANKQHLPTKDQMVICSNGILTDTVHSNDTEGMSGYSTHDDTSLEESEDGFQLTKSVVIVGKGGTQLTNSLPGSQTTVRSKESGSGIGSRLEKYEELTSQGYSVLAANPVLVEKRSPQDGHNAQSDNPDNSRSPGQRNVRALQLQKTNHYHLRVVNDKTDPEIKGLAVASGNTTIADNGNKKIRLIDKKGHSANMTKNILKDNIPAHALVHLGHVVVYICGSCIYIADKSLRTQLVIQLKIDKSACRGLILCKYTDTSFMVGNLPENLVRVYSINGQLMSTRRAPVPGPITAMSLTNDEDILFSCPGAVSQIQKYGNVTQVFRPPNISDWFPEGTCMDRWNNLYVANSRQNQIHVFGQGGEQLCIHSTLSDNLESPRCLAISLDRLIVSGDHPHLFVYTILEV
ncbi:uncharacterized protein LOC124278652 [Haliotis rubra]|uniref:uncharacterized protein LOC124278652 n=1 Tax=Haliotis rubra TaxID=36100 RepID=UPI001EE4F287|nr:uncharacterized protein LOC124278652 [Haliotis rubra]